jgi:AAHS family 4-hydroxybenzoate transporter-like MFS transporter
VHAIDQDDGPHATLLGRLDAMPIGPLQIRTFLFCFLITLLDGVDNQSIGIVAPLLAKDIGLSKTQLGLIFSITQVGATIGVLSFGPIADRFGRKTALSLAVCGIALFTYLTAVSPSFGILLCIRLVAGVALAGAMPSALALASEYAPARVRVTLVSVIFAGYPFGAALGGFMSAYILAHHDWRWVFYIGAILPFVTLVIITIWMPESVRYLLARGGKRDRVRSILIGLGINGADIPENTARSTAVRKSGVPIHRLFSDGLLVPTLLLWMLFFFAFATTKIMVVWLPTLLNDSGFNVSQAALAQASFNIGCAIGMAIAGRLIDLFGTARALGPALVLAALAVAGLGFAASTFWLVIVVAALVGFLIGIGGSGAHTISASIYPTPVRSTGIGFGVASSRLGQVVSPMLVATMMAAGVTTANIYYGLAAMPLLAALAAFGFAAAERRNHDVTDLPMERPL